MSQQSLWSSLELPQQGAPVQMKSTIQQALLTKELRPLDVQFQEFIARQGGDEKAQLAALLVSDALGQGHSCLPLDEPLSHYGHYLSALYRQLTDTDILIDNILISDGHVVTPIVRQGTRLYLYRYWQYEQQVAKGLLERGSLPSPRLEWLTPALDRLFQPQTDSVDWQRVAAVVALNNPLAVISGGPGTGKTTTVVRMLALWLENSLQQHKLKTPTIRLAAPTGKAAARLAQSIAGAKHLLNTGTDICELIPETASTLHRLLGALPGTKRFRHHRANPLHLDLLVVDEASMVDLPMMARLLDALPSHAQLLLIGDRDQLASVEAGSVLGDICAGHLPKYTESQQQLIAASCGQSLQPDAEVSGAIANSLALLHHSYRFDQESGIGHLARAVNEGDHKKVEYIFSQNYADISLEELDGLSYQALIERAVSGYTAYLQCIAQQQGPESVLSAFSQCQLLCALREGPYGVAGLNEAVEHALGRNGLIRTESSWYSGRPVMISRNEPSLSLFNGDIGIAMPDASGRLKVWFEQEGELRAVLPSRLPDHQTVYAMTIHKSQGSEFNEVLMVLPDKDVPVLTRELVYTGITRAKSECRLYSRWPVFAKALQRQTRRNGGLKSLLWR